MGLTNSPNKVISLAIDKTVLIEIDIGVSLFELFL